MTSSFFLHDSSGSWLKPTEQVLVTDEFCKSLKMSLELKLVLDGD